MSYQFKVGDKGKTRDRRSYRVICSDRSGRHPVVALLGGNGGVEVIYAFTSLGRYGRGDRAEGYDLMPPSVTKWLNVWRRDSDGSVGSALCNEKVDAERKAAVAFKGTTYLIIAQPVEVQES